MKKKKIFIAVLVAAALVLAPTRSQAQTHIEPEGSWGSFTNSGSADNINGSSGSWGNFNNVDPYAPLGSGLALLTVAGIGYACAKRRKAKAA